MRCTRLCAGGCRPRRAGQITAALTKFRSGAPQGMRIVNQHQFDRLSGYLAAAEADAAADGGGVVVGDCDASNLHAHRRRSRPGRAVDEQPDRSLPVVTVKIVDDAIRFC